MKTKKAKGAIPAEGGRPKAGFYGPEYRSPQATEWLKASDKSFLQSSVKRALDMRDMQAAWADQSRDTVNSARYLGGSTYNMGKGNKGTGKITNPNQ